MARRVMETCGSAAYIAGMSDDSAFAGAKLALFLGPSLLVIRRDVGKPIPYPGYLDFPGGGREAQETAEACVLRETWEEVGLTVRPQDLLWKVSYPGLSGKVWFFAARMAAERERDIVFGNEGQGWMLMSPDAYAADAWAIPPLRDRMLEFVALGR